MSTEQVVGFNGWDVCLWIGFFLAAQALLRWAYARPRRRRMKARRLDEVLP